MQGIIEVAGSHGVLQVDIATGIIVEAEHYGDESDGEGYHHIARFEPASLAREAAGGGTDILYTGYWTNDGVFEPALTDRKVIDNGVMELDDMVPFALLPAPGDPS